MKSLMKCFLVLCSMLVLAACSQQTISASEPELPEEAFLEGQSTFPGNLVLNVISVTASAHDGNLPENTLDNNLNTRWSALGDSQWIRYDLGTEQTVGAVQIAFYRGDRRVAYFDIETSSNGADWDLAYSGQSSGVSKGLETFVIADTVTRYVRIVGHTNSENSWNSLSEVKLHDGHGYQVAVVTASADDGNLPQNTRDSDLRTRWSAFGDDQWINYDLGQPQQVGALKIAFYRGDNRVTYFDVEISLNGLTWTHVFIGQSSGTSRDLETFILPTSMARYVRIIGHTNSENNWNSLTEVEVHAGTPGPEPASLILWNTLDSQSAVENSAVGLDGIFDGGSFAAGVFGGAYKIAQDQGIMTRFSRQVIPIKAGTIELWAKLEGYAPNLTSGANASEPRLFRLENATTRWSLDLRSNDGLGGGGIIGDVGQGSIRARTTLFGPITYEDVLGVGKEENWHHYALVWDEDGIAGIGDGTRQVAVFLDGALDSTDWFTQPSAAFSAITEGELVLAFNPFGQAGTVISLDNLKIWNVAKTDFSDRFVEGY